MTMRLDKFISEQTTLTRTQIKKLIAKKAVTVDGAVIRDGSMKIQSGEVQVCVSGKPIEFRDKVYYILNKPKGYVCATRDSREKTVLDLLSPEHRRKDIFPTGRLDKDTTGMVLLTNDGELSHKILSPGKHIPKYYIVELAESPKTEYVNIFNKGVELADGDLCLPARIKAFENGENTLLIEIFEGKFHQIKRMFEAVGNQVVNLRRIQMGGLAIPLELGLGEYVEIMHKNIGHLFFDGDFEAVFEKITANFSSYWINI